LFDKTLICVPIFEKNYESVIQSAKNSIEAGADLVEFRIDAMDHPNPDDVVNIIKDINHPLIATNRRIDEGGFFKGSESERTEILLEAAKHADIIDIELVTDSNHMNKIIKASKSTIISYHDFEKTPPVDVLLEVVSRERKLGDIAKFAVMPNNISDTLVVLNVLSQVENTVGISMGDFGRYTRIVAPLFGSPITFASLDSKSAPGQLDIQSTKNFLDKLEFSVR
jgi:3-dehydroquinate dehydratase I